MNKDSNQLIKAEEKYSSNVRNALALLGKENKTTAEMRTLIVGLETVIKAIPDHMTAKDFDTRHHFSPGIYMRELFIPKGTLLTGKIHKTEHLNILSHGHITVWTEGGMKTLKAPHVIKSQPGIKRVGLALEDSVWVTVHENKDNCTNIEATEARLFADTFEEAYLSSDRTFSDAINYLGFTDSEVQEISENSLDQTTFPSAPDSICIKKSEIHGNGVFATRLIEKDELIAPARIAGLRTPSGRYCNHGGNPNIAMKMQTNGDVDVVALRQIRPGEELLNDYFLTFKNTRIENTTSIGGIECQLQQ